MPGFFSGDAKGAPIDVVAWLDGKLSSCVGEIVALGALVSLTTNRQGTVLKVTVTVDSDSEGEWFRHEEEAVEFLTDSLPYIREAIAARDEASASDGQRKRRTRR